MQKISYEGSSEIGAYARLTSAYLLIGRSENNFFASNFANLSIPVIETTINSIRTVGSLTQGNKYGLLLPNTTHDHELFFIRQNLPENIKVRRIDERLNALGNIILCNDHIALVHPEIEPETVEAIKDVLRVPVHKICINDKPLVGTYAVMNNQGMLVEPKTSEEEMNELRNLVNLRISAGTVNMGNDSVGGGIIINDYMGFCGKDTTNPELGFMEKLFLLTETNN
ncbi:hypothetical protein H311_03728 [Anncaliia algerae PRA109]|nr:hypothetical protein H311_03728 [Anncaliia algerae PRA109]